VSLWLRIKWALGLTEQCPEDEPFGNVRSACQRREGHPGMHDSGWLAWHSARGTIRWRKSKHPKRGG
jgi:hypothetical protein